MSTPSNKGSGRRTGTQHVFEISLFAMFASLMFASKILMEAFPNIHLLGMFTIMLTVVFRARALIPIYLYVFLNGLFAGFDVWWFPYLYIWTILWGLTMLVPKSIPRWAAAVIYPLLCGLHGFAFGVLYSPAQALFFGFGLEQTVAWIIAGIPFDVLHGISNIAAGLLVLPLSTLLKKLLRGRGIA